jgi:hypothetical protein
MEFEWDKGKAELNLKKVNPDELRPEYNRDDLGNGIRGKHYDDYKSGTNLVLLSPDVATMFPDEDAVNKALRDLIKLAKKSVSLSK